MGKERQKHSEQDVSTLLSNLHITKSSVLKARHGPPLPRRPITRKAELLQAVMLDISPGDQMEVDRPPARSAEQGGERSIRGSVDVPALLQLSDLLNATRISRNDGNHHHHHHQDEIDKQESREVDDERLDEGPARMKRYIKLIRSCGLATDVHYTYLQHFQSTTSSLLSSSVFDSKRFWTLHVVYLSISNVTLHAALLAVSGIQFIKSKRGASEALVGVGGEEDSDRRRVQTVYRLRAEVERRLRFHHNESDHEVTVAAHVCLLVFDYLTGNQNAWEGQLVATKLAMRAAKYSTSHQTGRYFFWTVARQDRLAAYMRDEASVLDVDDLLWDDAGSQRDDIHDDDVMDEPDVEQQKRRHFGRIDQVGQLYAELLQISTHVARLTPHSPESDFDRVDAHLARWKDAFPLSLQTYGHTGDVHDSSCFLHALTCDGGSRAVALHCLFHEVMIQRLAHAPVEWQMSRVHEHAMTICKLSQSLTSSVKILDETVSSDMSMVLGSLYVAGLHLFSREGKAWLERLLLWAAPLTGNAYCERVADRLSEHWREVRTRPQTR